MGRCLLLILVLLFFFLPAHACLNELKHTLDRREVYNDTLWTPHVRDTARNLAYRQTRLQELDAQWRRKGDLDAYSDYGLHLVYLERYAEARAVFLDLERRAPGRYSTAANLGTLYELIGKNDSALLWIGWAIRINPAAHDGSEWIHVNILKVKLGKLPLSTMGLLGFDSGNDKVPQLGGLDTTRAEEVRIALQYQLEERMGLVPPPDSIVAQLLFDMGNLTAILHNTTDALRIFDAAAAYGYKGSLFDLRYRQLARLQQGLKNEYTYAAEQPYRFKLHEPRLEPVVKKERLVWILGGGTLLLAVSGIVLWRALSRKA
ncbi:hypothetical protein [Flaviaesturariibacter amylovorans]|uniref:Tetratricopeptide repeat protein n=1 Tax=Flaviaesturariibacter amylovorans TaxID=1084520 RepID=A0ABP8HQL3_9BACT